MTTKIKGWRERAGLPASYEITNPSSVERALLEEVGELRKIEARYNWLKQRFTGYHFYWMGKPPYEAKEDQGKCIIAFDCGDDFNAGRDWENEIDQRISFDGANA